MQEIFRQAKRAGVPLVMIETADCSSSLAEIIASLNGKADETPVLKWDMVRGLLPANEIARKVADELNEGNDPAITTGNPVECLRRLDKIPEGAIVCLFGADKVGVEPAVRQAIWNLRDSFKSTGKMLVLLSPLGTKLSNDIKDDVVVIEHALPDEKKLEQIAKSLVDDAGLKPMTAEVTAKTVDATLGLSEFAAEQVVAMSVTKNGIDTSNLWDRKRKAIEQTAGLSVWKGGEKFSEIGGCDNAKQFFGNLIKGKRAPRCIVFVDEIEKAVGSQQDTSGTSQAMLGTMLRWMQDKAVTGCILIGPAGCAKSAISKAVGNEANVPTIEFDLSAMKGSLVGESEAKLRGAIATVDAIGQGRVMVLATCNSIGNLPPELRRRFTLGTFFFDLPTAEERSSIWKIYRKRYGLNDALPEDNSWTGAEIRQCCDVADRLGVSLKDASNYVVPVARSAAEVIETLRKQASGRFLSASYKGVYQFEQKPIAAPVGRKIATE